MKSPRQRRSMRPVGFHPGRQHPREIDRELPIGMFDSGVGGFTVLAALKKLLPREQVIYYGDSANIPYGEKPPDIIRSWALNMIEFLLAQKVKAIAVACNVSSSVLRQEDIERLPVPVFGLVYNGATAALRSTKNGRIGVIATPTTVATESYVREIRQRNPAAAVLQSACPRFVPLIESGHLSGKEVESATDEYIAPLLEAGVDTIIYGCTHYPLLAGTIADHVDGTRLVDPSVEIVKELSAYLREHDLLRRGRTEPDIIYASKLSPQFIATGRLALGYDISGMCREHVLNRLG